MMSCYYCARVGVVNDDRGSCAHCNVAVCTPPPAKLYQEVHGETCACGCGRLYCEVHLWSHAHDVESSQPEVCFPEMSSLLGGSAFEASAAALASGRSEDRMRPEAVPAMNRFINVIQPGHQALAAALGNAAGIDYHFDLSAWAAPDSPVVFAPSFYSEGTLERILVLSASVLGQAADWAGSRLDLWPGDTAALTRRRQLWEFSNWASRGSQPPYLTTLEAWLPPDRLPGAAGRLFQVMSVTTIPSGASAIADWFVHGHAPAAVGA